MNEPTICYVAGTGDLEMLQRELENANCDLEVTNSQGLTALMMAARENHLECVRALILAGANPNAYSSNGTASEFTVHPEILRILAEARAEGYARARSQENSPNSVTSGSPSVCRFFMKGYCRFGNSCRFSHQGLGLPQGQPEPYLGRRNPMPTCRFWLQGNCRFGNQCRYEHPIHVNPNIPAPFPYPLPVAYVPMPPPLLPLENYPGQEYSSEEFEYDREIEERIENFGFSEEEVLSLLAYGVMPWESNAWEILKAIQN
ncbi:hypothetical protein K493DRAFT_318075 [Basidiobolus meristosporus CBS 931.73]|uniref:C3H1-type domain-containing protein n=1 Tax=Basidiobolus meristosporus CBS 931.73 TaxID=1314790 RepID=A0A1Y1XWZ0_9FUNG|nr:hypothetical protein K493DRAFT_318075 [Basidiobolus meristosporus CBS 931.73]|eukprot:ORX90270.1 hypothetical protein K493DRAFT_318075 [Basidiobolus meristosporus CBS 931.73]